MAVDELRAWSRKNWGKIPELVRQDCLNELKARLPNDILELWKRQKRQGIEVGSDDMFFHHGVGMAVRNVFRTQLTDKELPGVIGPEGGYPTGELVKNWDDYYLGGVDALVEQELKG